jgi:hypothetical protein
LQASFRDEDRRAKEREIPHSVDSVRNDRQSKSKNQREEGLWRAQEPALRTPAKDGAASSSKEWRRYSETAELLFDYAIFQEIF